MSSKHSPTTSKRMLTLGDWMIVNAVYALDFAGFCSGWVGVALLSVWGGFMITFACILLYIPRGLDRILSWLLILIVVVGLILPALHATRFGWPPIPPPNAQGRLLRSTQSSAASVQRR